MLISIKLENDFIWNLWHVGDAVELLIELSNMYQSFCSESKLVSNHFSSSKGKYNWENS